MNLKKRAMQLAAVLLSLAVLLPSVPAAFASQSAAEGTAVVFSESGITAADESGLSIDGTTLTIEQAGTYVLSGTCSDGSVKVKKGVTGVTLVLSGLDLTSSTTVPITCGKSSGVTILAAEGTENALTDAAANNGDNYPDNADAENAVIKCKDGSQVTIGGTGTLTVTANGKNGIKSGATTDEEGTAWLVIEDLTLTINAPVNDAVNAEASLTVKSGTITIDAGDDALHADYALAIGESGTAGPTITINSCYEGLAGANLLVASGAITIYSEDDCLNAANSDLTGYDFTIDHQRDAHHKARQDAGLEEVADGGAGRDAVDHERDGRRNDDADRARRGGERRGIALVIALLLHLGDHERADGRHRRRAGARDGRVEHGGERRDRAETAGEEADDIVREVEQALGDAAVAHEVAREHEERNRHQGEAVDAREGILRDHDRVDIRREDEAEHRRKTHRDADGQADRAEHDQADKQNR